MNEWMNDIRKLIVCGVNFSFKCNPFNKFNFMCQHSLSSIRTLTFNVFAKYNNKIHFPWQNMRGAQATNDCSHHGALFTILLKSNMNSCFFNSSRQMKKMLCTWIVSVVIVNHNGLSSLSSSHPHYRCCLCLIASILWVKCLHKILIWLNANMQIFKRNTRQRAFTALLSQAKPSHSVRHGYDSASMEVTFGKVEQHNTIYQSVTIFFVLFSILSALLPILRTMCNFALVFYFTRVLIVYFKHVRNLFLLIWIGDSSFPKCVAYSFNDNIYIHLCLCARKGCECVCCCCYCCVSTCVFCCWCTLHVFFLLLFFLFYFVTIAI